MVNLCRWWKLYRIRRELRQYSPEMRRWIIERGCDPSPLKPIPEKR
jgi:hypothetical protein